MNEMKCRSKLLALIDNNSSPLTRLPSFNEVILRCQGMLEKIMSSLSRPFLVQVAQQVCEKVETNNANVQSSGSAVHHSPVKSAVQTSPRKSPAKLNVPCSSVTLDTSKKDKQVSSVAQSPAKQSAQPTVAVESSSEKRKTVDNVSHAESTVRPSTSTAVNSVPDLEISDESETDSVDVYDDDWWRPSTKRAKKGGTKKVWSTLEEEMVYKGVKAHGIGSWALIHANFLPHRTNVDIKDKWRTMVRQGRLKELARQFGPLPLI